ncbi:LysR family transcriptional regulator [Tateyamaria sp. SN3-11]|uniref:LysR family transcriptional regulator n=1 Tax=Tateyamaria sp. SN3-11 TaxID=3092147 RepID=UPI0039E8387F
MDWDQLRILLAIHRSGSLRGAAQALGVSHATIARGLEAAERGLAPGFLTARLVGWR